MDEGLPTEKQLAILRTLFDKNRRIENDEDLLELAKLVEDESDEDDMVVDYDFDFGAGN